MRDKVDDVSFKTFFVKRIDQNVSSLPSVELVYFGVVPPCGQRGELTTQR